MTSNNLLHKIADSLEALENMIPLHQLKSFKFGFKNICVSHTPKGIFAFEDACPHKLVKLSEGELDKTGHITCFWHQYKFDVATGEEVTGKNTRWLKLFPILVKSEGVYIEVLPTPIKDEFSY
jgi:nitrite reductase/ring-hydroxylating ferredoxin subunit